jgi:ribose transport system substrate-binding protein
MKPAVKWTAIAAAALAGTALVTACSSSSKSAGSSTTSSESAAATTSAAAATTTSAAAAGKLGKIIYIPGLTGNPFYNTVSCGAGTEAKAKGVAFQYTGSPTFDVQKQTAIVQQVALTKPGAIMISVTDPKAMAAPLKAAKAKGVKIITIDGDLTDTSIGIANVQSDSLAGGKLAGVAMAKAIGSTGTVLPIDNSTGFVPSKQRTDGFAAGVHSVSPNVKVLPVQYSNNDPAKAASFVQQAAAAHPDLKGVFGAETNNTQGALTGVREAGKQSKIKITGYDTSDPIVTALKAGQLLGVVVQNPRGEGVQGVDTAIAAMQGKSVTRNLAADALFVTPATVNTAKAKSYIYDVNCKIQ